MAYFNYHAKAQGLIRAGHCVQAELVEAYKEIRPALVLFFDNHTPMPIRVHKFAEYIELLTRYHVKIECGE